MADCTHIVPAGASAPRRLTGSPCCGRPRRNAAVWALTDGGRYGARWNVGRRTWLGSRGAALHGTRRTWAVHRVGSVSSPVLHGARDGTPSLWRKPPLDPRLAVSAACSSMRGAGCVYLLFVCPGFVDRNSGERPTCSRRTWIGRGMRRAVGVVVRDEQQSRWRW